MARRISRLALLTTGLPLVLATLLVAGGSYWLADNSGRGIDEARAGFTTDVVGQLQADRSSLVLTRLDELVNRQVDAVVAWARAAELVESVAADYPRAAELAGATPDEVEASTADDGPLDTTGRSSRFLESARTSLPGVVRLVATDANGFTVGATDPAPGFRHRDQAWWTGAWDQGAHLGPVETDGPSGIVSYAIAVRVDNPAGGDPLGVVLAVFDVASIQAVADLGADPDRQIEVVVAAADGRLLAETATDHDPARIGAEGVAFGDGRDAAYSQVLGSEAETGYLAAADTVSGYGRLSPTRPVSGLGIDVASPVWVAVVDQPTAAALAPATRLDDLDATIRRSALVATVAMGLLSLAALLTAVVLARRLARRFTGPLDALRSAANRLAHHELPALLRGPTASDRLPSLTEPVSVEGDREVAELAGAFNTLRATAIDLAASQAIDRDREVATVLVNLGRRNQQLIGRQLRFIDDLERTESNPDTLRNLFALDQMATRMRRNAESLLVLAGEDSPRRGTQPRPVDEVVRAATSEVEDFARVVIGSVPKALIDPRTVSDLTHLLAELIENATLFSPPETTVDVSGEVEPDGSYSIVIVDRGLGLPHDRLDEANARLASSGAAGTPGGSFMGLYVVGRLAARHDITARLASSPGGGTTARVHLPLSCLASGPEPTAEIRGSRLHVSGPLTGPHPGRASAPPPAARRARPAVEPRRPERPERASAPVPPVVVPAYDTRNDDVDDETQGQPIPPFKSRQSRRNSTDLAVTTGSDDLVDPENRRFQVRRRVRRTDAPHAGPLDVATVTDEDHGLARAAEVREKLNRFASGVEAAKKRQPPPSANGSEPARDDREES